MFIAASLFIPRLRHAALDVPVTSAGLALVLILLSAIDAWQHRLPDKLTLPLLAAGLIRAALTGWQDLLNAAIGAFIGYAVIWSLAEYWRRRRGVEGIGLGDAKLLAAGGAWCGAPALPLILLLASGAGLVFVAAQRLWDWAHDRQSQLGAIAFGPFLSGGIWIIWLWSPRIGAG